MTPSIEYTVEESADAYGFWYRHGYQGASKKRAEIELKRMRNVYGKYGRRFRLVKRTTYMEVVIGQTP